jgi:hypothetical protein
MDASDLTPTQAAKLHKRIRPMFDYLAAMQKRMDDRQFYRDDRLYLEVKAAHYALQLLTKELHRLACGPG